MSARITQIVIVLTLLATPVAAQEGDALDETLALVGMQRGDLGWRPKGWWPRFPADVPYKLRAFDPLFAEPLDNVTYCRSLAEAAKEHLDPEVVHTKPDRFGGHLFQAVHRLGVDPKFGGLRGYTANVIAPPTPLDEAILEVYRSARRPTKFITFDMELPYPTLEADLRAQVENVPEPVQPIVGQLIVNIIDARLWADRTFRNVEAGKLAVAARRFNLGEEQVDAFDYCPEIDDVARAWDEASLWYAGEKIVQALDDTKMALMEIEDLPAFVFDWETPWGWIRLRGTGNDRLDGTDALLIVDLGGNDEYTGAVAASNEHLPIAALLDCGGDDRYEARGPAQGAGICGIGVLIDAAGNDVYQAERYAQGVGQFGLGVCADLGGDDTYFVEYSGQGCGYFGPGLLLDCDGNDSYRLYADGQGLGGVGGVGVLADRKGDDTYEAVRDSTVTKRPSYHSPDENITVSNAQGCAMGRRADGGDGHSWAGGLGALLDSEGNDKYTSGNWSMGTGYWFGIGYLHDGGGDDEYRGVVWSQGTVAHFAIGVLVDEGGNDLHAVEDTSNNSLAFGHDFAVALLVNIGGDDRYQIAENGLGYSINRSVAALIDVGGDDTYSGKEGNRPGTAIFDERFRARDGVGTYFADTTSIGLFLDVGGNDTYWSNQDNNSHWLDEPDSPNWTERNFSLGADRANGEVTFRPRPEKPPSAPVVPEAAAQETESPERVRAKVVDVTMKSHFRGRAKLTIGAKLDWVVTLELLDDSRELNAKAGDVENFLVHSPAKLFRGESPIGEVVTIEVTREVKEVPRYRLKVVQPTELQEAM